MCSWLALGRVVAGLSAILALSLIAGGEVGGQGIPKPKPTPQQVPPGGPKLSTLPDLVVLQFHYSTHVCDHWGPGKSGYRGWFEVKNEGLGAAPFESTHKYVGIYFRKKMFAYSTYQVDNSPFVSGALG